MFHSLAARALLMATDHDILIIDAVNWVTRKFPKGLKDNLRERLFYEVYELLRRV